MFLIDEPGLVQFDALLTQLEQRAGSHIGGQIVIDVDTLSGDIVAKIGSDIHHDGQGKAIDGYSNIKVFVTPEALQLSGRHYLMLSSLDRDGQQWFEIITVNDHDGRTFVEVE